MSRSRAALSISAVAAETGVSVANLRAWELRYGFPRPQRLASGHRRYTEHDVEHIRRVLAGRAAGLSLDAAIARLHGRGLAEASIFAGLRERWPDLAVHVLSKRVMLAISHAIEDECWARAARGIVLGAFQEERFYRRSEARWRELARTADQAVVFADFPRRHTRRSSRRPVELPLPPDAPLLREWAVVCHAPEAAACLAGVERQERPAGRTTPRRFEAVWSVDPRIVHDAATIGAGLAHTMDERLDLAPPPLDAEPAAALRRAAAITSRVVAYLDR